MTEPANPHIARWQTLAGELATALTDLVKNNFPNLADYLAAHAVVLRKHLSVTHLTYGVAQGSSLQRVYTGLEEDVSSIPHQNEIFEKAMVQVMTKGAPVFLPAYTQPPESLRVATGSDVPLPEDLPFFNATASFHSFLPIPLGGRVIGVVHVGLSGINPQEAQLAAEVLMRSCALIEVYIKNRQSSDFTAEIGRLQAYSDCLEGLCGDLSLGDIAQKIAQYAKQATGADRVSVLVATNFAEQLGVVDAENWALRYEYLAGVGEQVVEAKSTESRVLTEVADYFLKKSIEAPESDTAPSSSSNTSSSTALDISPRLTPFILSAPQGKREPVKLIWIRREEANESSNEAVLHYLDFAPMNWVTYIPLVDSKQRIVGIVLFEGKGAADGVAAAILKSQSLVYSGGRALATGSFWHDRSTLRWAKKWIEWKDGTLNTPKKRKWAYFGLPLLILFIGLLCPIKYRVKADAQIRPREVYLLSAQTNGRILNIQAHEGNFVRKGEELMTLDTKDLEYQRQRLESEFLQHLAEADSAQGLKDETTLQMARFKAQKVEAQLKSLAYQIESAHVRAIFDAVVLGPQNLQQKIGHMAKVGDPLVELAKPDSWEVKVQLKEQDLITLQEALSAQKELPAKLKLKTDPNFTYELALKDPSSLAYGLEPQQENYYFIAVLPLPEVSDRVLKAGFKGKIAFEIGFRPAGYVLLKDFVRYLRVYWL